MLEILAIIWLVNKIGKTVEAKGRKSGIYKWLAAGLWIGGEIAGLILGAIIGAFVSEDSAQCIMYLVALGGAATGALIAITIANHLEPVQTNPTAIDPPN